MKSRLSVTQCKLQKCKEMHIHLHVKYSLCLSISNQKWQCATVFHIFFKYYISWKSVHYFTRYYMRTNRLRDGMTVIGNLQGCKHIYWILKRLNCAQQFLVAWLSYTTALLPKSYACTISKKKKAGNVAMYICVLPHQDLSWHAATTGLHSSKMCVSKYIRECSNLSKVR